MNWKGTARLLFHHSPGRHWSDSCHSGEMTVSMKKSSLRTDAKDLKFSLIRLQDTLLHRMRSAYICLFKSQLLTKIMCLAKFATREPALHPTLFQWSIWVFCVATWCSYNLVSDLLYRRWNLGYMYQKYSCNSTGWHPYLFLPSCYVTIIMHLEILFEILPSCR